MKKISFSERYGLQQAVIAGTKTMTRRIVPEGTMRMAKMEVGIHGGDLLERIKDHSLYMWRDEVAIAQSYSSIVEQDPENDYGNYYIKQFKYTPAWTNKMFVKANFMPHRIRITDIRVERLQDISEADIAEEGIRMRFEKGQTKPYFTFPKWDDNDPSTIFLTPREAFAALIDRISGKGTWQCNPWVFVYEFELIK